jgi:hypothetical protein
VHCAKQKHESRLAELQTGVATYQRHNTAATDDSAISFVNGESSNSAIRYPTPTTTSSSAQEEEKDEAQNDDVSLPSLESEVQSDSDSNLTEIKTASTMEGSAPISSRIRMDNMTNFHKTNESQHNVGINRETRAKVANPVAKHFEIADQLSNDHENEGIVSECSAASLEGAESLGAESSNISIFAQHLEQPSLHQPTPPRTINKLTYIAAVNSTKAKADHINFPESAAKETHFNSKRANEHVLETPLSHQVERVSPDVSPKIFETGDANLHNSGPRPLTTHQEVADILASNFNEEDLTRKICRLSFDENNKLELNRQGATTAIIGALQAKGRENELVAIFGCKCILNLTCDENQCKLMGQLGACEAVCEALHSFSSNEDVALDACGAICNLAFNDDNCRQLSHFNAFQAVLQALSQWGQTNAAITYSAIVAISNLMIDPRCTRRFGKIGGPTITSTFGVWAASNPDIALEGCIIVRNLAEDVENATDLGKCGACQTVIEVLNLFCSSSVEHTFEACLAVRNLSISENNREILGSNGACQSLIHALETWMEKDAVLVVHTCLALRNLTSKNSANVNIVGSAGGCEVIIACARKWMKSNEDLAYAVCALFWNLAYNEKYAVDLVVNMDVCGLVADALRLYGSKNQRISSIACGTIVRLIQSTSNGNLAKKRFRMYEVISILDKSVANDNMHAALRALV